MLSLLLGPLAAVLTVVPAAVPQADDVDDYLRERAAATGTPGLAYAIVDSGGIEEVVTFGHDGDGAAITPTTPFLWGSVSKPVTATAVLTLVEDGRIDLDQPVRTYLPEFTLAGDDGGARITVRQLLEHTSGIPDGTDATDRFDERADPYADAVAELGDVAPLFPPGERHEYSSAGYVVLGALVEAVTGDDFATYLRRAVLDPLGMSDAVTTPDEAARRLPDGHSYAFGRPVSVTSSYDVTGPAYGYLGGSVEDLARYAADQLAGRRFASRVLGADSIAAQHTGQAPVADGQRYGLGWRDDDGSADLDTRTVWHGGAVQGYQAMVVLLPEQDRGIVVLQNVYGSFQDGELAAAGLGAARILAGGQPDAVASDSTYVWVLCGLGAVVLTVLGALAWTVRRLLRPTAARSRRRVVASRAVWIGAALALAWLAAFVAPAAAGGSLRIAPLYAPDVAGLLIAVIVAALALAAFQLVAGVRQWRRAAAVPAQPSPTR